MTTRNPKPTSAAHEKPPTILAEYRNRPPEQELRAEIARLQSDNDTLRSLLGLHKQTIDNLKREREELQSLLERATEKMKAIEAGKNYWRQAHKSDVRQLSHTCDR